jgi:hypothetical protein
MAEALPYLYMVDYIAKKRDKHGSPQGARTQCCRAQPYANLPLLDADNL